MPGKTGRKIGRSKRKPKTAKYKNEGTRHKNKLKRVRQSNGMHAAREYGRGLRLFSKKPKPK